jgi:exodeoxyribonuclease VII small subunit
MAKAAPPSPDSATTPSFEASLQELERIVQAMETGDASLDDSLAAYERGMVLLKHCQDTLAAAEHKLRILENGVLHDFEPPAEGG